MSATAIAQRAQLTNAGLKRHGGLLVAVTLSWLAWALLAANGATLYVSTSGSDANPGTIASPFRTVQRGINVAVAGDTVLVSSGLYDEYVETKASGTGSLPIRIVGTERPRIRAFRANGHQWVTLDGFQLAQPQNLWGAHVRIEPGSHNTTVTNCLIGPGTFAVTSQAVFSHIDNSITAADVDWAGAGFIAGGRIYHGGSGLAPYNNHDRANTIASISGSTMFLVSPLLTETVSPAWSPVFAGAGSAGMYGVWWVTSGGSGATNCLVVGNTVSNIWGHAFGLAGSGNTVTSNTITKLQGYSGVRLLGSNQRVSDNFWIQNTNFVHYTAEEFGQIPHPAGPEWYDYQVGFIHSNPPDGLVTTNNVVERNWFQDLHNPVAQIGRLHNVEGLYVRSNVFVGVQWSFSGARNRTHIENNTFFRTQYDGSQSYALTVGGSVNQVVTDLVIRSNVFVDIGGRMSQHNEWGYSISFAASPVTNDNFYAGPETRGFDGRSGISELTGVNGGDPRFRNISDPLGPDGLPFTLDDGLRPMPGSTIANRGLGALAPVEPNGAPVAQFSIRPTVTGWFDPAYLAFNPGYTNALPWNRPGKVRPWNTIDAVGSVPCEVVFDGSWAHGGAANPRHNHGVTNWVWSFGDGHSWTEPWREKDGRTPTSVTHMYYAAGTYTVSLTIQNRSGQSHTTSRQIRVLANPSPSVSIHFVAPATGSDSTGTGDAGSPWATLAHAYASAPLTNTTHIIQIGGSNSNWIYLSREPPAGQRVHMVGRGATTGGFGIRAPRHTIEGFTLTGAGMPNAHWAAIYVRDRTQTPGNVSADDLHVRRCVFNKSSATGALVMSEKSSTTGTNPDDLVKRIAIDQNLIAYGAVSAGYFNLVGRDHTIAGNYAVRGFGETDFARLFGRGHTVSGNYVDTHDNGGGGGHTDFVQWFGYEGHQFADILVENNTVCGRPEQRLAGKICQLQHYDDLRPGYQPTAVTTNIVFRNNIFFRMREAAAATANDVLWVNNLFYECDSITTGGSAERGSAWNARMFNNAMVRCGTEGSPYNGWYRYDPDTGWCTLTSDHNMVTKHGWLPVAERTSTDQFSRFRSWGQDQNSINGGDPMFVDAANYDWRLRPGSPLIRAGIAIPGHVYDAAGRPWESAPNIGPFSSIIELEPEPPQPPLVIEFESVQLMPIPAGLYVMGDSFVEGASNERPLRTINLSSFGASKYEITNWDLAFAFNHALSNGWVHAFNGYVYLTAAAGDPSKQLLRYQSPIAEVWWTGSGFAVEPGRAAYPANYVSWHGALAVCNWLSQLQGFNPVYNLSDWTWNTTYSGLRLPTEAEWEIMARGGLFGARFPWGDTITHSNATYLSTTNYPGFDLSPTTGYHPEYDDHLQRSAPIGSFDPNGYGLFDVAGNVWEWVWDWSGRYNQADTVDPLGPVTGTTRVFRGGSWKTDAHRLRNSMRYTGSGPEATIYDVGFRVVRSAGGILPPPVDPPPTPPPTTPGVIRTIVLRVEQINPGVVTPAQPAVIYILVDEFGRVLTDNAGNPLSP